MSGRASVWRERGMRVAMAAATAVLYGLAVEVDALWFLIFVAWVPWLRMLEGLESRAAFGYAALAGIAAVHSTHLWMIQPIVDHVFPATRIDGGQAYGEASLPWSNLALATFSLWQGLAWGIAGGLLAWVRKGAPGHTRWLAPGCFAGVEVVYPDLFPVSPVVGLAAHPTWIQLAEIGGLGAICFAVLAINAGVFDLGRELWKRRKPPRGVLVFLGLWLVGVPAFGQARIAMVDSQTSNAASVRVGVVQGNFGIETLRTHRRTILRQQARLTKKLEADGAQLVLWSERAYPFPGLYRDSTRDLQRGHRRLRRGFSVPLVFGAHVEDLGDEPGSPPWSRAWVMEGDGSLGDGYDKVHPLPMIEEERELGAGGAPNPHRIRAGDGPVVLEVGDYRIAPLLGHEDLLATAAREAAAPGMHLLASMCNESWFGHPRAKREHLRLAVFRAVELRRGLVRATSSGISAFVDPAGRIRQRSDMTNPDQDGHDRPAGFVADVPLMEAASTTVYGRLGDGLVFLMLLGVLLTPIYGSWRRRNTKA